MQREEIGEFEVAGSKDLDFEANPMASLQYVVGGLVSPHPATSFQPNRLNAIRDEMTSPVRLSEALASQFGRFRECLDAWRKCCKRLATGKLPKDLQAFAAGMSMARDEFEWHCLETAVFLGVAHEKIRLSAGKLFGVPMEFYLGVPQPIGDVDLAASAAKWHYVTRSVFGGTTAIDQDWPLLLARSEFVCDEMAETLKELGRQALWLWTNEPSVAKVRELVDWLFDLRCECLEAVPTLAALEPFLRLWQGVAADQP